VRVCPERHESAGKRKSGKTPHGDRWLIGSRGCADQWFSVAATHASAGDTNTLIPLFALGVFIGFTLSPRD